MNDEKHIQDIEYIEFQIDRLSDWVPAHNAPFSHASVIQDLLRAIESVKVRKTGQGNIHSLKENISTKHRQATVKGDCLRDS